MTQEEFECRLGRSVSKDDYEKIEKVYLFHPSIDDVSGKDEITTIFKIGGMRLINDMMPTAMRGEELETEINRMRIELEQLKSRYEEFKRGDEN